VRHSTAAARPRGGAWWRHQHEPILGHLTVKAIGPGGTAERTVGVYHPDPAEQP
jgi:hypothetical protein